MHGHVVEVGSVNLSKVSTFAARALLQDLCESSQRCADLQVSLGPLETTHQTESLHPFLPNFVCLDHFLVEPVCVCLLEGDCPST